MEELTKNLKRRQGKVQLLSAAQLEPILAEALLSRDSTELAFMHLIDDYEFDLDVLKAKLVAKDLDISFSRVKYVRIAPFVGLEPTLSLRDAPTCEIHRARLPDDFFEAIIGDIEMTMKHYGPPIDHPNAEMRSRFLSPVFDRTVALFRLLISNTPESIMPKRFAKDRTGIEYQFRALGAVTIIYIQVKLELGTHDEHLNAVAQLIGEANGCDLANSNLGFGVFPIYGILCDGTSFKFFLFDSSTKPPTFSRCRLSSTPPGSYALSLADLADCGVMDFIASFRPICEAIFYFFLSGYTTGLRVQYQRSYYSEYESKRQQTDAWKTAICLAEEAMHCAVAATAHAATSNYDKADEAAKNSVERLKESVAATPSVYQRPECELRWQYNRANARAA